MGADTGHTDDFVTLRHRSSMGGTMECVLSPRHGGSIARLAWHAPEGTVELMRPAPAEAMRAGSAIDMGCFPLIPFSNRIDAGQFRFDGREVRLPLDLPGCPHAIHGHAWRAHWRVEERTDSAARLSFRHPAGAWPWTYTATQIVALDDDGLTVVLDVSNDDQAPMPAGIGLHPYFPKPPGTVLKARVGAVWLNGLTMLPVKRAPLPDVWAFPDGVTMDRTVLDNGFTGWDGRATLTWPGAEVESGLRLTLLADGPFGHLVVYAPEGENYLCVEPVTHMTDAINHGEETDAGLAILRPGERLSGTVRFELGKVYMP